MSDGIPLIPALGTLDTETTGTDPEQACVVTAYIGVQTYLGEATDAGTWLVDPGVEIPDGAAAIHGITTDIARENGQDPVSALLQIESCITSAMTQQVPLVVFNAAYDLTLLDREIRRRLNRPPLYELARIIDPLVLDKAVDPYRKGSRKLVDIAEHYGVPNAGAHGAKADAIMAARVAFRILEDDRLALYTAEEIHRFEVKWRVKQQEGLIDYFRRTGKAYTDVSTEWPSITWKGTW